MEIKIKRYIYMGVGILAFLLALLGPAFLVKGHVEDKKAELGVDRIQTREQERNEAPLKDDGTMFTPDSQP